MVSRHPAKFGGHWNCDSRDIMLLICHVILQDHLMKEQGNFMGRNPPRLVTILPRLMATGTVVVEI